MIKANVISDYLNWKNNIKKPNDYLNKKLKILSESPSFKKKNHEFSLLLTNDKQMKYLNLKFRKKNKTTDVLSFPINFKHKKGFYAATDRIVVPHLKEPITLKANDPVLLLLQHLRDETHKTAVMYHQKRRRKRIFGGTLDGIKGVGFSKKRLLLKHFGSFAAIKEATEEQLQQVRGIGPSLAKIIKDALCKD